MGSFWSRWTSRQEESHEDGVADPAVDNAPLEREPSPPTDLDGTISGNSSRRSSESQVRGDPAKHQAVWVADGAYNHCQLCKLQFSILTRRHHCRHCGHLVCDLCSPHRAIANGFSSPVRVCMACFSTLQPTTENSGGSRRTSATSSRSGSRRTSPNRLVAKRHAEHKEQQEAEQRQSQADTAQLAAPVAVRTAEPELIIRQHHTSYSSSSVTATAPEDVHVSLLPPHHTPASSLLPGHTSNLSLSVGGASTITEAPSPSPSNAGTAAASSAGTHSNSSPRTGVRRLSLSRETSPSLQSGSPKGRRKSISGQPAFQPQHNEEPEASPIAAVVDASNAASSSAAGGVPSHYQVSTLSPLILFNRLAGFGSLLVLDLRSTEEYKAGHVPRALNIPLTDGDLLPSDSTQTDGTLQPAECTVMLSALEQRLHMTDQRAFRMRPRCTVILVGSPYQDLDPQSATLPSPYSTANFLSSRHHPLSMHLARLLETEGKVAAVSILSGGYDAFAAAYPFVCCNYTKMEMKTGKHIHKKPFPWVRYPFTATIDCLLCSTLLLFRIWILSALIRISPVLFIPVLFPLVSE
jgi:hypothetical protein